MHGYVVSTVGTDALVLKHQGISTHGADWMFSVLDLFYKKNVTFIVNNVRNRITFRKKWPSRLRINPGFTNTNVKSILIDKDFITLFLNCFMMEIPILGKMAFILKWAPEPKLNISISIGKPIVDIRQKDGLYIEMGPRAPIQYKDVVLSVW